MSSPVFTVNLTPLSVVLLSAARESIRHSQFPFLDRCLNVFVFFMVNHYLQSDMFRFKHMFLLFQTCSPYYP